jgi:integrase
MRFGLIGRTQPRPLDDEQQQQIRRLRVEHARRLPAWTEIPPPVTAGRFLIDADTDRVLRLHRGSIYAGETVKPRFGDSTRLFFTVRGDRTAPARVRRLHGHPGAQRDGAGPQDAGIPHYHPHDRRHRRISLWHGKGEPLAQIASWAGHSRASFTLENYVHVMPVDEIPETVLRALIGAPGDGRVMAREPGAANPLQP